MVTTTMASCRQRGFTLIEVMVAMLLTVIAVIGIVALYLVETRSSGFSRHETEAAVLAEDKLEELRALGGTPGANGTEVSLNELGTSISDGLYTRVWTTAPDVADGWTDISVTVTWTENGVARTLTESSRY